MEHSVHNKLVSFIWSIADDCLRDVYVRGKYRDVILPMFVLRRLDTLLEPSKDAVLEEVRFQKEELAFTELDDLPLKKITGHVFYNTSKWTLKSLYQTASKPPAIRRSICWPILKNILMVSAPTFRKSSTASSCVNKSATCLIKMFC
ncbi:hypothetical protein BV058_00403 [Haemophilus influenzae]|nr:hypothetical protein BV059_01245 [Haemophilus influenzae]PRL66636.1 hypothetical protein BV058_00403 [Haemophilus influenzae]